MPFESVKRAVVSKFGGMVDWKPHEFLSLEEIPEHRKKSQVAEDVKMQEWKELGSTKRLMQELKLKLEIAQIEEHQLKQESERANLRVEEMEQGNADAVAKVQLEVANTRHAAAISELKSTREEMKALSKKFLSLVTEKELALKKAEETVSAAKEIEKTVEELTLELIATKELLESAHAAHLEIEEQIIAAATTKDVDSVNWKKELKQTEEEMERLNQQLMSTEDPKPRLDTASALLLNLEAELAAYMGSKLILETEKGYSKRESERKIHGGIAAEIFSSRNELEEAKFNIDKAKAKVSYLKVAASSLQLQLKREKSALLTVKQREGLASVAVQSIEADLHKIKLEIDVVQMKEKEARQKVVDLPKQLQQATHEADEAKCLAQIAREELCKAKKEGEQAKAGMSTLESRLDATQIDIEAAEASDKLAVAAIKALQEIVTSGSTSDVDSPTGVTLSLEEYYDLSKQAFEAEEQANKRVEDAILQLEMAKESELRSLEKLEQTNRDKAARVEALNVAMEMANEVKLDVEQQSRKWKANHKQKQIANNSAAGVSVNLTSSPTEIEEVNESNKFCQIQETISSANHALGTNISVHVSSTETDSSPEGKVVKMNRRSSYPRILKFLARRKSHSSK